MRNTRTHPSSGIKITKGTDRRRDDHPPSTSTKNKEGKRDPDMHQTPKGQHSYFGMKVHIGVDRGIKLVHTVFASAANVHDREVLPYLLHVKDTRI
jgi:transposase, IS5 family